MRDVAVIAGCSGPCSRAMIFWSPKSRVDFTTVAVDFAVAPDLWVLMYKRGA